MKIQFKNKWFFDFQKWFFHDSILKKTTYQQSQRLNCLIFRVKAPM